jgi:hypothetical protein
MNSVGGKFFAVSWFLFTATAVACRPGAVRSDNDPYGLIAECPRNERILASGRSITEQDKTVREAYDHIRFCRDPIGALARAWSNPPTDIYTLEILQLRSAYHADQRMLALVLPIATDTSRPPLVRWAAMGTLVQLYDPCQILTYQAWSEPSRWSTALRDHCSVEPGDRPLTAADRERILALFNQMAASDPDARVRVVSKRIAFALTPIPKPPLVGRFSWTHVNEKPVPVEFPAGSGTTLVGGFLELGDSTAAARRFTLGFTFRAKPSDTTQTRSHGGTFRVVGDTLLFTNDGAEGKPPVRFRYYWALKDLVMVDAQGNRWWYVPSRN